MVSGHPSSSCIFGWDGADGGRGWSSGLAIGGAVEHGLTIGGVVEHGVAIGGVVERSLGSSIQCTTKISKPWPCHKMMVMGDQRGLTVTRWAYRSSPCCRDPFYNTSLLFLCGSKVAFVFVAGPQHHDHTCQGDGQSSSHSPQGCLTDHAALSCSAGLIVRVSMVAVIVLSGALTGWCGSAGWGGSVVAVTVLSGALTGWCGSVGWGRGTHSYIEILIVMSRVAACS